MRVISLLLALVAVFGDRVSATAEEAVASPVPMLECRIAPRMSPVEALLGDSATPPPGVVPQPPVKADQPSRDVPIVRLDDLPPGPDATPAVRDGIVATVRELTASFNAGDDARIDALHTDDFFRRVAVVDLGTAAGAAIVSYGGVWFGQDAPAPTLEQFWILPDGRVGATFRPGEAPRVFFAFAPDPPSGRYLIDEEAYVVDGATPAP
jgi:hypothetical protein